MGQCKNFNSFILSCHTWNIPKNCTSWIYKQWKSDLDNSWECFLYDNSELNCWNFNGDFILPYLIQWVMIYSFGINTDLQIDPKSIPHTVLWEFPNQGNGSNWDLFPNRYSFQDVYDLTQSPLATIISNQYLFQKNKSQPIVKDREKWNIHWNFNSFILSFHTWNIPMNCTSWIYKQWKSDLDNSWECFMYENSELSCWNFNGDIILPYLIQL